MEEEPKQEPRPLSPSSRFNIRLMRGTNKLAILMFVLGIGIKVVYNLLKD